MPRISKKNSPPKGRARRSELMEGLPEDPAFMGTTAPKSSEDLRPPTKATEAGEAKQETRKNEILYVIDGATSPAATPLASPIFLIRADQLVPDKLEIYKLESKNGRREVLFERKKKQTARPIHRNVTRVGDNLYRIDVGQTLENGEYSITPNESNQVFCFRVY